jgi:hypothetical protein
MYAISTESATIEDYRLALEAAQRELNELRNAKQSKPKQPKREYVFTPFQAAKVMNEERALLGLKEVSPQMIYSYARKDKFGITEGADGRKQVDVESFYSWMREFNAKNS